MRAATTSGKGLIEAHSETFGFVTGFHFLEEAVSAAMTGWLLAHRNSSGVRASATWMNTNSPKGALSSAARPGAKSILSGGHCLLRLAS